MVTADPGRKCIVIGRTTDGHVFIWVFRPELAGEACRCASKFAADPIVPLSWNDCAKINSKIRGVAKLGSG
jgi:hypothetical protein